jgi:hypothetical protein
MSIRTRILQIQFTIPLGPSEAVYNGDTIYLYYSSHSTSMIVHRRQPKKHTGREYRESNLRSSLLLQLELLRLTSSFLVLFVEP